MKLTGVLKLADTLANSIKTIAERGATARKPHNKNSKGKKRQAAVQHVQSTSGSSASKKARMDDADEVLEPPSTSPGAGQTAGPKTKV